MYKVSKLHRSIHISRVINQKKNKTKKSKDVEYKYKGFLNCEYMCWNTGVKNK